MSAKNESNLSDLLFCPETHAKLLPVTKKRCDALNKRISAGEVRDFGGNVVEETIEDGLLTSDELYLYPIRNGVPNLFISDRIVLA